ncbi:hypothetical protein TSOC_002288 [Tetrabaena socialis]|nr:hypothetical protein TSOC_002288 [Tetrabaena socialis]|eukprot:PNH10923.1 hypothetical protein TSOC_002288 [Tetrabaena socialis]
MAAIEEAVVYDMRPYDATDLCTLLYGFAATGTRADRLFARAGAALPRQLGRLEPEPLTQLAEAHAVQGAADDTLFEGIAAEVLMRSGHFTKQQVERIAASLRALGYAESEELMAAWRGDERAGGRGGGAGARSR